MFFLTDIFIIQKGAILGGNYEIKRTWKKMKYCMFRFTMSGIPLTESVWFSITSPRTIPLLV